MGHVRGYRRSFTREFQAWNLLGLAAGMIKSAFRADELALLAFKNGSAVDTVLPVMNSIILLSITFQIFSFLLG